MAFRVLAFVLPLGLDTLAIAIALGLRGFRPWRPALLFTSFEALMPVFGIVLIAVQTFLVTVFGVAIGNRVRAGVAHGASHAGIAAGVVFAVYSKS